MKDRKLKLLLAAIALGIWALVLRPALTPAPSHAAEAPFGTPYARFTAPVVRFQGTNGRLHLYVVDNTGCVYMLNPGTLQIERGAHLAPLR